MRCSQILSIVANPPIASSRHGYFLPLFLMPWAPVFSGPLPPALAAISLRAFSSVFVHGQHVAPSTRLGGREVRFCRVEMVRTGTLPLEESNVVIVIILRLLLGRLQRLGFAAWRNEEISMLAG